MSAAERGPAGPVDGQPEGSRMGKAGEVPYGGVIGLYRKGVGD